jgi:two-component system sensor histidine kinase UhpB
VLCDRVAERGGMNVRTRLDADLSRVTPEMELVVYRVAQEALTNALRHAEASEVLVELRRDGGALMLRVVDDGRGVDGAPPGSGIQGMRERALLANGRLAIRRLDRGTEVRLSFPPDGRT